MQRPNSSHNTLKSARDRAGGLIGRVRRLLHEHIWDVDLTRVSRFQAFFYRQLRVAVLVVRDLLRGRLFLQASAMTFTSLLTIVPLLVVSFAVIRGLGAFEGLENRLEQFILESIVPSSQSEVRAWIDRFLVSARGGAFSGVNLFALLAGGFGLLSSMEGAFNDIWGIRRGRPIHQRLPIYLTLIVLGPPLVALALTLTADLAAAQIWLWITAKAPELAIPIGIAFKLAPAILIGIALTLLYTILPNARVRLLDALPAGLIAAVLFEVSRYAYTTYLASSIHYNALYGSIAALPIFLVWVHSAWVIVLFGAELTFARDAADDIRDEELARDATARERLRAALRLTYEACRQHLAGEPPPRQSELAHRLQLPVRLVGSVSELLTDAGILHLVAIAHEDFGLVPARTPDRILLRDVVDGFLDCGVTVSRRPASTKTRPAHPAGPVDRVLQRLESNLSGADGDRSMADLVALAASSVPPTVIPFRRPEEGHSS